MPDIDEKINQLISETCKYPPKTPQRQRGLSQIYRLIVAQGKLWHEDNFYYEDVWQQTWLYFCLNLCESNQGKKYDPNKAKLRTWLNNYLRWRLMDYRGFLQKEKHQRFNLEFEKEVNMIDRLQASPDIPPILEEVRQWVKNDPDGVLRHTKIKKTEITAQMLILLRLPPEKSWKDISSEFGIPISTLSSFYERKCRKFLRNFGHNRGYI